MITNPSEMGDDKRDVGVSTLGTSGRITKREQHGAMVVDVGGEFDVGNASALREALVHAARDHERIVLDLSNTTYLDSSTIALILSCSREAQMKRADLRIVAPVDSRARRVFAISGIESSLSLFDAIDDALPSA